MKNLWEICLMSIYSLKQGYYLYQDAEFILNKISQFYTVDIKNGEVIVESNIPLDKKHHFASKESKDVFNNLIPEIKTLHTSMYHLLESIYRATNNNEFNVTEIEERFPDFKYFRMLNNKIKHFNETDIDLIEVVFMDGLKQIIEIGCQYKIGNSWEFKSYSQFIRMVILILKELQIVAISEQN